MTTRHLLRLVAVLATLGAMAIAAAPAYACDPHNYDSNRTNDFPAEHGWALDNTSFTHWDSLKATFDVKGPTVYHVTGGCNPTCPGDNLSYIYVMHAGVYPAVNWAQFGPEIDNNNTNQDLLQCVVQGVYKTNLYRANPEQSGTSHTYRIDNKGNNVYWALVDGSHVLTCPDMANGTSETVEEEIGWSTLSKRDQYEGKTSSHETIGGAIMTHAGVDYGLFSGPSTNGYRLAGDAANLPITINSIQAAEGYDADCP